MRDISLESTIYPRFTTRAFATGIPTTLAGTPVLSVYEENNLTQITSGVSVSVDYDSVTGLNQATIVATAANGYEVGKSYDLVITTGTVDSVSVVGEVVFSFTVEGTRAALVDDIWDEPIAGHLTAGTAGLSEALGSAALVDTTITGTPTTTDIQLTAGSAVDGFYNDQLIYVLSGTGIGQVRPISGYTGATRTVTVDEPWVTIPAAAARVAILVSHVHPLSQVQSGLATAAALSSVLTDTNELQVAHTAGTLGANVKKINSVTITGDGSATPFNV